MTDFYYIRVPTAFMREKASYDSKVVSEAICSEKVILHDTAGQWAHISTPDGYHGWVLSEDVVKRSDVYATDVKVSRCKAHIYIAQDIEYGPKMSLPWGVGLKVLDSTDPRWLKIAFPDGQECYIQKGDVEVAPALSHQRDLVLFSQQFFGLPYTWGGRSSFGYDCSGFVQMLYGEIGVDLQRDAKQQIQDPRFRKITLEQLEPGDLVFFGKKDKSIRHVGLYMGDQQFIHATAGECKPWIRISRFSDKEWSGHPEAFYPYRTARQYIQNTLEHA